MAKEDRNRRSGHGALPDGTLGRRQIVQLAMGFGIPMTVEGRMAEKSSAGPADERAVIKSLRAEYNAAIAMRRPELFARVLSREFVQLSSDGTTVNGIDAVMQDYQKIEFSDPSFIAYDRQPDEIIVSGDSRFAVERGHWRGRFRLPAGGETGNAGLYQAGWFNDGKGWKLRTEAFVKLTCADPVQCR